MRKHWPRSIPRDQINWSMAGSELSPREAGSRIGLLTIMTTIVFTWIQGNYYVLISYHTLPELSHLVVKSLGGTEVQIRRSPDGRFQTRSQWLQNPSTFHSPSLRRYGDSEWLLESLNASEILFPWIHLHWKLLREYSWLTTHRAPHTRLGTCGRARAVAHAARTCTHAHVHPPARARARARTHTKARTIDLQDLAGEFLEGEEMGLLHPCVLRV